MLETTAAPILPGYNYVIGRPRGRAVDNIPRLLKGTRLPDV